MSKMKEKPWENSASNDKPRILFHPLPNCRDSGMRISKQSWILHSNKSVKLVRKCLTLLCSRKMLTVELKALKGDNDFGGL
jgi:hypothetical protein